MIKKIKPPVFTVHAVALLACIVLLLGSGCDILKLGNNIDKIKSESGAIGENLGAGLVDGLDTTHLDSLVQRVVRIAGQTLNEQIDSVHLQNLESQLKTALLNILGEGRDSIKAVLADTTALDNMDAKIQGILFRMSDEVNGAVARLIPNALNDRNLQRIYGLRDSLLGPTTAGLLRQALIESVGSLIESEQLDSLIRKVTAVVDTTTEKVDASVFKIDKTVARIGGIIAGIILAVAVLLLVLWFRKRTQAKKQKELLVKLTKAIDAIPDQKAYDHTIAVLEQQISDSHDPMQQEMLNNILREYKDQYPEKKKYKAYQDRLIQALKAADTDGSVRRQLLEQSDDEDFSNYLRNL